MRLLRKACTLAILCLAIKSCNVPDFAEDFLKDFKHDFVEYVINVLQNYNEDAKEESKEEVTGEGAAELVYVVDGDTIIVSQNGEDFKVRMIGCNTPESVHEDESRNTIYGTYSSDYTKDLLKDVSVVYLEYDEEKYDDEESGRVPFFRLGFLRYTPVHFRLFATAERFRDQRLPKGRLRNRRGRARADTSHAAAWMNRVHRSEWRASHAH